MTYPFTPEAVRVLYEERLREAEAERRFHERRDGQPAPRARVLPALRSLFRALRPSEQAEHAAA